MWTETEDNREAWHVSLVSLMLVTQVTLITCVNTREIVGAIFIVILIPNSTRVELQNETMDVPLGLRTTCDQLKEFPQVAFSRLASSAPRLFQEHVEKKGVTGASVFTGSALGLTGAILLPDSSEMVQQE